VLCKKLQIDAILPYLNKSKRRTGYRDYYDGETMATVAEVAKRDIELFSYEF